MDNLNEILRKKSINADQTEYFVFLPNDLNQINSDDRPKGNKKFDDAIAAKNKGNDFYRMQQYDAAIKKYDVAIETFESLENVCNFELAVCYQNRAAAKESHKNYSDSILDASKAIELNDHYSKAYYRRARAYNGQRKYYRALQDIVQACILERFKNKTFTDMVGDLLTKIDEHSLHRQWQIAFSEMEAAELHCDHCVTNQIRFVKNSGILHLITVPIPDDEPPVGYLKAMVGLEELNVDKIMAGCKEEEDRKGPHLAESFIVRAYMNTVAITSPSNLDREFPKDLRRMNELIWDVSSAENIKFNALLCRANMYNRQHNFLEANRDLKTLEEEHPNNPLVYIIKSGSLMQFPQSKQQFMDALNKCCSLLPNVYELHLQQAMAEVLTSKNSSLRTAERMTKLKELINRFPKEIEPRMCLAGIYAKMNETYKAKEILKKCKKDFPDRTNELSSVYGMLNSTKPCCVTYFRRSLKFNKDDPGALEGLLEYFFTTTYEYAKAIEVATKALYSFLQPEDFQLMFEHRQALLHRIFRQEYWDRL